MKYNVILSNVGKVILTLLLVMPIIGSLGIFPAPPADMYQTPEAFQFINLLMQSRYIMVINSVVYLITLFCLWTRRTALAALLLLPISINIVGFHTFLDGGLLTGGAVMGNVLLLLNLAFLWQQRANYKFLWEKRT